MKRTFLVMLVTTALAGCGGESSRSSSTSTPSKTSPAVQTLKLDQVATAEQPVGLVPRSNDPALYVVEKTGRVRPLRNGKMGDAVLDIAERVSSGSEQGLLGLAFSPDGTFAYVNYTDLDGDTHIDEYSVGVDGSFTEVTRELLFVKQPFPNHNGGNLAFGPDNRLYVGLGDGGSGGDPNDNAQNPKSRLGKMLVIDTGAKSRPVENFAIGLRNPWRFSFDRLTGDLWIADVGQGDIEEVNHLPAGSPPGGNFGWNRLEGTKTFEGKPPANAIAPVHEYNHDDGRCSVTGGFVYRGKALNISWAGRYFYGDFCDGKLHTLRADGDTKKWVDEVLPLTVEQLSSFGEDNDGELYALSLGGSIYKLAPSD